MNYPEAYCVKCHEYTDTLQKHTVIMNNSSRALTGVCPKCESEVFRFLTKKKEPQTLSDAYPDAYCLKCKETTSTSGKHTVVLQNSSRALKGQCQSCGCEVYKFMPKKQIIETAT